MSTANFYNRNASKIFAAGLGDDDDEITYDLFKDDLVCRLKSIGFDIYYEWVGGDKIVARLRHANDYCGGDLPVCLTIDVVIRSGYYQGWNVDYNIYYEIGDNEFDPEDKLHCEDYQFRFGISDKKERRLTCWIGKYLNSLKEKYVNKIEKELAEITTPLICTGVASNGEAFYKKA